MALIAAHLNAGHSGGDSVTIGIYSPSSPTSIPPSHYSPSLISLMVSVDVKHHVYLLTALGQIHTAAMAAAACSLSSQLHTPFSPSLISLMVSVSK